METEATLYSNDKLSVKTTAWTNKRLEGFHGTAAILILGKKGDLLCQKELGVGVNGSFLKHKSEDWEEKTFDNIDASEVGSIQIIHSHDPANIADLAKKRAREIKDLEKIAND